LQIFFSNIQKSGLPMGLINPLHRTG